MSERKGEILEEMVTIWKSANHGEAKLAQMAPLFAELNIIISNEFSVSLERDEALQKWVVEFTIGLFILTIVLIVLTIIILTKM